MWRWLDRNAGALGALGALMAGVVAVLGLGGIWWQIRAAEQAQALQTARGAYLAQQALAVTNPGFAQPGAVCTLLASDRGNAYEAFVAHLLFTAEQVLAVEAGWEATMLAEMEAHADYLCRHGGQINGTDRLTDLIGAFTDAHCTAPPAPCQP
jgi:hypothetical protein